MLKLNFDAVVTLGRPEHVKTLLSTGIKMAVIYGAYVILCPFSQNSIPLTSPTRCLALSGAESAICNPLITEYAKAHHADVPFVAIPDAEHHVLLDQVADALTDSDAGYH